jgi:hypothetical protein
MGNLYFVERLSKLYNCCKMSCGEGLFSLTTDGVKEIDTIKGHIENIDGSVT